MTRPICNTFPMPAYLLYDSLLIKAQRSVDGPIAELADEQALVARAATDPSAFAVVYDHYFPRIYTYVRYRVSDVATADDLVAQIFERVLRNIGSYQSERAPFAAWLFALARNAVSDHLRAQQRHPLFSLDILRHWKSPTESPEEIVLRGETHAALLAAVAQLNERERDIIALKFAARLTNRRIAAITGLSESNVGVMLYRALQRLRKMLEATEVER